MKGFKSINEFTLAECQEFLQRNDKDSALCEHVYARMESLLREQREMDDDMFSSCKTLENYQEYNSKYPNGRHIEESKQITERLIWEKHSKSRKLCQSYITNYPNGTYIEEAKKALLIHQKEEKRKHIKRCFFFALGLTVSSLGVFVYPFKTVCICRTLLGHYAGHLQNNVGVCLVAIAWFMVISTIFTIFAWVFEKWSKNNGTIRKYANAIGLLSSIMFFIYGICTVFLSFIICTKADLIGEYKATNSDEVEYRDSVYNSNGELIAVPVASDSITCPSEWTRIDDEISKKRIIDEIYQKRIIDKTSPYNAKKPESHKLHRNGGI